MELVYLWIKRYKNIHNQGFNFSPKFRCDYNFSNKELTINENVDYISDFFGKNINIIAIVGKNGSGKSSILECIKLGVNSFFENDDVNFMAGNPNFCSYILLYRHNNQYYDLGNVRLNNKEIIKGRKKITTVKRLISKNYYYYHTQNKKNLIELILDTFHEIDNKFITFFHPDRLVLNFFNYIDKKEFEDILNKNLNEILQAIIRFKYKEIKKKIKNHEIDCSGENIRSCIDKLEQKNKLENWFNFDDLILKLNHLEVIEKFIDTNDVLKIFNEKDDFFYEAILKEKIDTKYKNFLLALNSLEILEIFDSTKKELNPEYYKDFGISFNSLSNGEKDFLEIRLSVLQSIKRCKKKDCKQLILCLDEPENNFHPHWQKNLLQEILYILREPNLKIELIITTHSPFLLCDIPKQNVIFLDKDENSQCKVVNGLKEKKETFGANIHTLLSDSFFMEDGLMGEFAKNKIDRTIRLLNQKCLSKKELEYCEQIIPIIGEPIIKNQLQKMLDSKRLSDIDIINQKIKDMSYELEILKQYQIKTVQNEVKNRAKKQYKQRCKNDKNPK